MRDDLFQVDVVWKREANFGNANAPPSFRHTSDAKVGLSCVLSARA